LLSAYDDPFLPRQVLDDVAITAAKNSFLATEFHEHGGHVGFVAGQVPWRTLYYAERRVVGWLSERIATADAYSAVA
jgi:predicted alpha/beta-fold hydrolase